MRICLVTSPTASEFDPQSAESEAVRTVSENAPIGILTLAGIVEQRGVAVEVVDLNKLYYRHLRSAASERDFCAYAARELAALSFDICGFSTLCSTYPATLRIAREVKRSHPEVLIMLGGPQASAVDLPTLRAFSFVDFILRGEADETLPLLLDALPDPRRYGAVRGVTFRCGKEIVRNPDAPAVLDLDKLPLPAFHLYPGLESCKTVPLELGRGCPFGCRFCSTNEYFHRRFRLKSPWRLIEQMRFIRQTYGNDHFTLIHDMFTVHRKRVVEFCEALLACGERFYWTCSARTDCVDDELIALMARAGCQGIFFGIETGSPRLQQSIKKNLDLTEAAKRLRSVAHHRMASGVSLITGFPDETLEDLRSTVAFLLDAARFDDVKPQLHILAPLAGTPIYQQYRDRLTLADTLSDVSFHGWRQDPADRELVARHPNIFPNFYAVPASVDRQYVKEFRDFFQNSMLRCRWLMVALHQDSGDLLKVFGSWRAWRRTQIDGKAYYASEEFASDLLEFVETCYLPRAKNRRALRALLDFELASHQEPLACGQPQAPDAPRLAPGVRLIRLNADYHQALACLRNRKPLSAVRTGRVTLAVRNVSEERLQVLKLSPLAAQLLGLCDGTRNARQIARYLRPRENLAGISGYAVCLFGLATLRRRGLIVGAGL